MCVFNDCLYRRELDVGNAVWSWDIHGPSLLFLLLSVYGFAFYSCVFLDVCANAYFVCVVCVYMGVGVRMWVVVYWCFCACVLLCVSVSVRGICVCTLCVCTRACVLCLWLSRICVCFLVSLLDLFMCVVHSRSGVCE